MVNNLYKLYRNSWYNGKPLEDFNTECFAEILNFYPEILSSFVNGFLELPMGTNKVSTQQYYPLSEDQKFYSRYGFESEDCICFIENISNGRMGSSFKIKAS